MQKCETKFPNSDGTCCRDRDTGKVDAKYCRYLEFHLHLSMSFLRIRRLSSTSRVYRIILFVVPGHGHFTLIPSLPEHELSFIARSFNLIYQRCYPERSQHPRQLICYSVLRTPRSTPPPLQFKRALLDLDTCIRSRRSDGCRQGKVSSTLCVSRLICPYFIWAVVFTL